MYRFASALLMFLPRRPMTTASSELEIELFTVLRPFDHVIGTRDRIGIAFVIRRHSRTTRAESTDARAPSRLSACGLRTSESRESRADEVPGRANALPLRRNWCARRTRPRARDAASIAWSAARRPRSPAPRNATMSDGNSMAASRCASHPGSAVLEVSGIAGREIYQPAVDGCADAPQRARRRLVSRTSRAS